MMVSFRIIQILITFVKVGYNSKRLVSMESRTPWSWFQDWQPNGVQSKEEEEVQFCLHGC